MIIGNITIAPIPKKIPKPVSGGPVYPGIELANENIEVHSNAMITPTMRPMTALIAPDINARGIAGIFITVFPSIIMHLRIQAIVKNQSEYKDLGFHEKSRKRFLRLQTHHLLRNTKSARRNQKALKDNSIPLSRSLRCKFGAS
jgi:hypothetical protein